MANAVKVSDIMSGFLYNTVTNLTNMDFFNSVVQFDDDPSGIASGEATFLFAGPPVLRNDNAGKYGYNQNKQLTDLLVPLGGVQQYQLNEGAQFIPFKELGSKLSRYASGSGQYSASMSMVLTKFGNLEYGLYSWLYSWLDGNPIELAIPPGANGDRHWISKESEIFLIPFGLLAITGAAGGDIIHVEYLERCFIQGSGNSKTAGSSLIVDNASIMVTRPVPFVDSNMESLLPVKTLANKSKISYLMADPSGKAYAGLAA